MNTKWQNIDEPMTPDGPLSTRCDHKRSIILNADDFGWSTHTVDATIACFEQGVLSSATIMPGMPAFQRAAEFAVTHPEFSFGLHLCLTDELPVSSPASIPSLVDATGHLLPTNVFWRKAFSFQLSAREIAIETHAQLQCLLDAGIVPSHLDGHGHIHKAPQVISILPAIRKSVGIKAIRRTQDVYYPRNISLSGTMLNLCMYPFLRRGMVTTDHFLMYTGRLRTTDEHWWRKSIQALPPGITEIAFHPGWDEEAWRTMETMPILHDHGLVLSHEGITILNYRDLINKSLAI